MVQPGAGGSGSGHVMRFITSLVQHSVTFGKLYPTAKSSQFYLYRQIITEVI